MSSFRSRARRLAFGGSNEDLSDASSTRSSIRSIFSTGSNRAAIRHSSSISATCTCHSHEKTAHVAPITTKRVRRIHRSRPFELFVEALEEDGCVIVEDFVNPQISQRVQVAEDITASESLEERESRPMTIDIHAMVRESLLSDSLYQVLSSHFLRLETISWQNKQAEMNASKPRVSSSSTKDLNGSINTSSTFHRADSVHHVRHASATRYSYQSRRDVSLGLFVPELNSLSSSIPIGAIPGSHLWDDQKPDVNKGVKVIQLRSGEALILLGSLYHCVSGTENEPPAIESADSGTRKEKLIHEMWMCSGIYRPGAEIEREDTEV